MKRALIATRVSSRHQAESGLGIEAQVTAATAYATAQGYEVFGVFIDEGISGAAPLHKRTGLLELLGEIQKGDVIIFTDRSRIGRDPLVVLSIEAEIYKSGGTIETADGTSEGDSPEQVLIRRMMDAINEFQRGILKAKTSMALQELKKQGRSTGKPLYGFEVGSDGTTLVELDHEQVVLKKVMRARKGGKTWSRIAKQLNEISVNRKGNRWTVQAVHSTFSKRVV